MTGGEYYLLHDEIVRPFVDSLKELKKDNADCTETVSTSGITAYDADVKAISAKCVTVRKHIALLTGMLATLARR